VGPAVMETMTGAFKHEFLDAVADARYSTGAAALRLARLEYADLDPAPYLGQLDEMAREVRERMANAGQKTPRARLSTVIDYLYNDLGFSGDREHYDDPRNSFLNVVIERRSGIPITLAIVFLEVAERAGLAAEGVNFPGHFLVRVPVEETPATRGLLIDPFHGGAIISESDCHHLLRTHMGEDAVLDPAMLATAGKRDILIRMLLNLKRSYVRMRSFPQARVVTELLVQLDPSAITELRDRGLLAYHLEDFAAALRDLQEYLRLATVPEDEQARQEHMQIWEHVKTLRRRIASFN
jgi:regulator of sirC expression with transglutaminase-like and TPR domain